MNAMGKHETTADEVSIEEIFAGAGLLKIIGMLFLFSVMPNSWNQEWKAKQADKIRQARAAKRAKEAAAREAAAQQKQAPNFFDRWYPDDDSVSAATACERGDFSHCGCGPGGHGGWGGNCGNLNL